MWSYRAKKIIRTNRTLKCGVRVRRDFYESKWILNVYKEKKIYIYYEFHFIQRVSNKFDIFSTTFQPGDVSHVSRMTYIKKKRKNLHSYRFYFYAFPRRRCSRLSRVRGVRIRPYLLLYVLSVIFTTGINFPREKVDPRCNNNNAIVIEALHLYVCIYTKSTAGWSSR